MLPQAGGGGLGAGHRAVYVGLHGCQGVDEVVDRGAGAHADHVATVDVLQRCLGGGAFTPLCPTRPGLPLPVHLH